MLVALEGRSSVIGALLPFVAMLQTAVGAVPGPLTLIHEHFVATAVVAQDLRHCRSSRPFDNNDDDRRRSPMTEEPAMPNQIDAIELLLRDHRLIDGLAEQLDTVDDPAEIRRLYLRIAEELAAHEAAEQEVVFPAFRAALEIADDTLIRRLGEHEELNELLAEMRSLAPDSFGFTKRGSALLLEIKAHFLREEESVFAHMRATLSAEELADLGSRVFAAKQHAPAFPDDHPRVAADR
jgi:hemerythrin superfamily protein